MVTQDAQREVCPTCMGKKVIEGICEVSGEWGGIKTEDGQACTPDDACAGQICTPTTTCPTCEGKGVVGR